MYGKILIRCDLEVRTGMHIGGSSAFSAIGAVDSPVVRDPYTGYPIVPGSSLKGKLRTLLARSTCQDIENMPAFDKDDERILRLFGSSEPVRRSRLQFSDAFLSNAKELSNVGVTEVKTENAISRANSVANPRQIERALVLYLVPDTDIVVSSPAKTNAPISQYQKESAPNSNIFLSHISRISIRDIPA